eukprot:7075486-Alexandrium_andersonii.AAC.1
MRGLKRAGESCVPRATLMPPGTAPCAPRAGHHPGPRQPHYHVTAATATPPPPLSTQVGLRYPPYHQYHCRWATSICPPTTTPSPATGAVCLQPQPAAAASAAAAP